MKGRRVQIGLISMAILLSSIAAGCQKEPNPYSVSLIEDEAVLQEYTYQNGSQITGIGDPYVFVDNGKYYHTATKNGKKYELHVSEDLKNWELVGEIFASNPDGGWIHSDMWQPQILKGDDGKYYLYYCGKEKSGIIRIGVAVADEVQGPYLDVYKEPLFDLGYAVIDAHVFRDDDGQLYMYYSRDCSENKVNGKNTSQIYVVEMESMVKVKEKAEHRLLLTPEQEWEMQSGDWLWNEGPDILKHDGKYYLFYSANFYADSKYSIGYAVADSPIGPFVKYEGNPILSATNTMSGPGNNSFFHSIDGKDFFTAYHTHTIVILGGGDRKLTIDRAGFRKDGTFYINGPTDTMQPAAAGETPLSKLSGDFKVEASSTEDGRNPLSILDGEFSVHDGTEKYEWASASGDEEPYLTIDLGKEMEVTHLFVYGSSKADRKPENLKISFDDGGIIENIAFNERSADASILHFAPITTRYIKITATEMGDAKQFGLAEVGIYNVIKE